MIIKNYHNPKGTILKPGADLSIIEDVTDVLVHAGCFNPENIGSASTVSNSNDPTTFYGTDNEPINGLTRHIDFTRRGVKCRLVVTAYAYICNDEGKTVEKVSC